jgi:urease accessory protein
MTVERLTSRAASDAVPDTRLVLAFEQRVRTRYTAELEDGRPIAVVVPRGSVMRGGDCWLTEAGLVVEIVAAHESLLEIKCENPLLLSRAAYHLGNRHVAVAIEEAVLRIAHDPVLGRMLEGLGLSPEAVVAPFEPEGGAYGHDHAHAGAAHGLAPVIHEYRPA